MDDLLAFLNARLAEDEQGAVAIFRDHTWSAYREGGTDGWAVEGAHSGEPSCIIGDEAMANHVARYDPARVLADVAAKRRIIDACTRDGVDLNDWWLFELLALSYADHPAYREEFKP